MVTEFDFVVGWTHVFLCLHLVSFYNQGSGITCTTQT